MSSLCSRERRTPCGRTTARGSLCSLAAGTCIDYSRTRCTSLPAMYVFVRVLHPTLYFSGSRRKRQHAPTTAVLLLYSTGSLFVLVPDGCGGIAEGYRRGAARTAELIQHYMQRTLYVFVLLVSASVVCSAYLATVAGLLTFRAEQIFNIFCFLGENGVATR